MRQETYYVQDENNRDEKIEIDLQPFLDMGLIEVCEFESEAERELYVNLAAQLDDGEAKSLAIAISRGWPVATDDKKARRVFLTEGGSEDRLFSTTDLVRGWAEACSIDVERLKTVLTRIEKRSRFIPPTGDPNQAWWIAIVTT